MSHVYEFIVLRQKDATNDIKPLLTAYANVAHNVQGLVASKHFQSFFALPQPDVVPVYVLLHQWTNHAGISETIQQLQTSEAFKQLLDVADMVHYAVAEQVDKDPIDVASIAGEAGQVFEVAFRRIHAGQEEAYHLARKHAFEDNPRHEAAVELHELRPIMGQNIERLTLGVVVYKNQAALQQIDFASNVAVQAFFATLTIETAQFTLAI
jgi:hypothetical protein